MNGGDEWMAHAACKGSGPEPFFPDGTEGVPAEVLRLCSGCPVRDECLNYALADPELHGIWAGTSQRQRGRMRKRAGMKRPLQSPDHGTNTGYAQHGRRGEAACRACTDAHALYQRHSGPPRDAVAEEASGW